ncbi:hypothetical protein LWI28_021702 [Acer negundo]|uniref:Gnk2-homologous domain-containing protein n=1 Tax=Acer negundo TaxID=4023 RepID=A0AAD5JGX7_ACENE|nr:hypothetical protein LWI28_021702 [Acer negundo]
MAIASSGILLFHLCALVVHLISFTINAQPNFLYHFCLSNSGNYTTNSTYQKNLNGLFSSISSSNISSEINSGFYNISSGQNSDKANAIALCRGDVNLDACRSCINDSISKLTQLCPNRREAIGWYDNCMLRYSNRTILGIKETSPRFYKWNLNNVSSLVQFNQVLRTLLEGLRSKAASGGSVRKFAAGNTSAPDFKTLYALVQCTPDLSEMECNDCLVTITGYIPRCCNGKEGGRVVAPSCNLRYEVYRFSDLTADDDEQTPLSPPLSNVNTTTAKGKDSNSSRTVIIIVVAAVAFVILVISICIFFGVIRKSRKKIDHQNADEIRSVESLHYDFNTIKIATNNFSDANKLGRGGFGVVYKGTLTSGEDIAVKRLSRDSGQGDLEFKNEVLLVARLQHRSLATISEAKVVTMAKSAHSSLFFFFLSILALSVAQQDFLLSNCQNNNGNYTSNSAFGTNLNNVLSSISSNTVIDYGFYNESVGQEPDMVNAIALCRGDASVDVCRSCLQNATQKILEVCPNQKEAVGWYDNCMLRYSNKSIFGIVNNQQTFYMWNTKNITENLSQALQDLLGTLRDTAASGDSHRKFDTGDKTSEFQRIYALVQCTPDLDRQECIDCLDDTFRRIPNCCINRMGGRVLNPSCNFRFEVNNRFFNSTPDSPSSTSPAPPKGNDNTARTVIIIVVPIVSVVILAICIFFFLRLRKRKTKPKETIESE